MSRYTDYYGIIAIVRVTTKVLSLVFFFFLYIGTCTDYPVSDVPRSSGEFKNSRKKNEEWSPGTIVSRIKEIISERVISEVARRESV